MHVFGAFELDITPGTPDNPASIRVALLRYTRVRMAACSSLRTVCPLRSWKGRSILSRTSWTTSANEPAAPSRRPRSHRILPRTPSLDTSRHVIQPWEDSVAVAPLAFGSVAET